MSQFLASGRNWEHVLAVVLLLARAGDVGSTYLVSPTLRLESNPVVKRLGWPFALLTMLVCFVPYYSTALGIVAIVASLFAAASNLSRGWIARALGEAEYLRVLERAAAAGGLRRGIAFVLGSSGTFALAGVVLLVISDGPETPPFWFGVGIILHGWAMAIFGCVLMRRLYRQNPRADGESDVPAT
jgi:hypothetical protein